MAMPVRISVTINAVRARRELTGIVGAVRSLGRLRAPKLSVDTSTVRGAIKDYAALAKEARYSLGKLDDTLDEVKRSGYAAFDSANQKINDYDQAARRTAARVKTVAIATAALSVAARGISVASRALTSAVKAASDLNETTSKTKTIFGASSAEIIAFSKTADRNLGLSQQAALSAASGFGDMFRQLGFAGNEATRLSKSTLQVAADLASFSNEDVVTVTEMISSAYRGEMDSLQRLVPAINAARVEQEALAQSGKKSAKELTAQDKALAVNAIVMKDSARAQGDYARTSDGLANVMRTNRAGLENLSATIGTALLPGVTALAIAFRDKALPAMRALTEDYAPRVNAFFTDLAANGFNASADLGQAFAGLKVIGESLTQLSTAGGSGLADTITVTGIAMSVLADHADLLAKAMPFLTAGFVAYKVAVLAANVAALASVPLKIAELATNRALVRSNQQLVSSRVAVTTATLGGTSAETASTAAKSRGVVASVASRAAMLASAAAAGVMTAAQWALNVAMSASPIGLIIIAVAAFVAAVVIAYKRSDTFRRIVDRAFRAVKIAAEFAFGWVKRNWPLVLGILTGPIGLAVLFFVKRRKQIVGIFRSIRDSVLGIWRGIGSAIVSALKYAINIAIDLMNKPIKAINAVAGKIPGVPEVPEIPRLASGGIAYKPTLALIGEAGPEAVVPLRGRGFGNTTNIYLEAHITSNDPEAIYTALARKLRKDPSGLFA